MKRCIVTYATGAHEELLDVALPTYRTFAERHGYDLLVTRNRLVESLRFVYGSDHMPPPWCKIPLLLDALERYEEAVWFDCDLVVVDPTHDLPLLSESADHALVRHFEDDSEVPNSGVWVVTRACVPLLQKMLGLEVFRDHGWWEQAALMTLMGYTVPPQGSVFPDTKCKNVAQTHWFRRCQFLRLAWNSHPNYRAAQPRIVHCSYPNMPQRLEVMRALVRDPAYDYPRYTRAVKDDAEAKAND